MHQDRARLEHPDRFWPAAIHQRRDFRVGIDGDKAAAELLAVETDQPGIVFRALVPEREQLFQHDRHFHAVRRGQRIELQGMFADRQFLVMGRACDRTVDGGETTAVLLVPGPDLWRHVFGGFGHFFSSRLLGYYSGAALSPCTLDSLEANDANVITTAISAITMVQMALISGFTPSRTSE